MVRKTIFLMLEACGEHGKTVGRRSGVIVRVFIELIGSKQPDRRLGLRRVRDRAENIVTIYDHYNKVTK